MSEHVVPGAVGSVLGGRYTLRAELGRGGMATVWRARDEVLHRDVAVKLFDAGRAIPGASSREAGEVRLLAGLGHPNLVAVHDAGTRAGEGFDYLVMELVDGETLRTRLDRGPLTGELTAALGAQLADALTYIHQRGVVHRDIKPANVLLHAEDGRAKLTDFGIARVLADDRLTMHGTTLGTANYLSPEQATGGDVGGPSDVYSLGLVLLECLTGRLGYTGHGVAAASARLHRPPAGLSDVPDGWHRLLAAMTALGAAARPSPSAVADSLRRLGVEATATSALPVGASAGDTLTLSGATGPRPDSALPRPDGSGDDRRRRPPVLVLLGVGLLAVLGIVLAVALGTAGSSSTPGELKRNPSVVTQPTGSARTSGSPASTRAAATTASPVASSPTARTTAPTGRQAPLPPGQAKKTGQSKDKGPGGADDKGKPGKP